MYIHSDMFLICLQRVDGRVGATVEGGNREKDRECEEEEEEGRAAGSTLSHL